MTTGREKFKRSKGIINVWIKLFNFLPKSVLLEDVGEVIVLSYSFFLFFLPYAFFLME